jgi:hypothetical protein
MAPIASNEPIDSGVIHVQQWYIEHFHIDPTPFQ